MKAALIIGGIGIVLIILMPALTGLRMRASSRMTDEQYFAAARKRAILHRLAKSASANQPAKGSGDE